MAAITTSSGTQYVFDIVEGQITPPQPVPDFFNRVGQTGTGVQTIGNRGEPALLTGHALFASLDLAKRFRDGILSTQASRCKYDDPMGYSGNVLIRSVTAKLMAGRFSAGSTLNASYRVEASIYAEAQS